jgi:hypothetical protein
MALTCHIEGSMITAIWTHLRMFQNSKLYQFMVNVEFCIKPVLGGVGGSLHCQYRSWTGSIKPSLQRFQFCCVGLSLKIVIFSVCPFSNDFVYASLALRQFIAIFISYKHFGSTKPCILFKILNNYFCIRYIAICTLKYIKIAVRVFEYKRCLINLYLKHE